MKPGLARFESELDPRVRVVHVDVDQKESELFRTYAHLLKGEIPYTALLRDGVAAAEWKGYVPYERLVADTLREFSPPKPLE